MRSLAAVCALGVACGSSSVGAPSPPAPSSGAAVTASPRLVVLVVIDQLPAWGLAARRGAYTRGLARLLDRGVHFARAEYPYAITFTAPGHAAIGTGAAPHTTGVVANAWYRRADGVERAAEYDADSPILGPDGAVVAGAEGASAAALRVVGLAEALRAGTDGRGRSVVIAGKARAAVFVGGRRPDVTLWYEPAARGFVTSARHGAVPGWMAAHAATHPLADWLDDVWALDDADRVAAATGVSDDEPGETDPRFPHRLAAMGDPAKALRLTPFLDTAVVDAAIAALGGEALGADATPDLLVLSFSSHDYAGHQWGQESWEMFDLERRLDRELGRFLDVLDVRVGAGGYAVVLTSDHGATRMPDRTGGARITPASIEAAAEAAAAALLGTGNWVAAVSSAMIYLTPEAAASPRRAEVLAAMATAVDAVPGVAAVVPMTDTACDGDDERARVACLSTVDGETGELLVWPEDGGLVTSYARGTSHDAPSADDRTVPIVVYAPGVRAREEAAPVSVLAVTATVARLLGVAPPPAAAPALAY